MQFPLVGIFLSGTDYAVAHEVELLLFRLESRITPFPQIYAGTKQGHLTNLGDIVPYLSLIHI